MAVLLLLIYAALCVVIFKIMRVPLNQWSVTAAGIGAVVVVGGLLAGMNYNHPFTTDARLYFFTTPVVPQVKGRVVEVPVKPNVALKKGDPLFKLDSAPYQFVVEQKKAALAEAEQGVKQLKASLDQASAGADKAKAQLSLAQANYDRQHQLFEAKDIAQAALDTAQRNLDAAPWPFFDNFWIGSYNKRLLATIHIAMAITRAQKKHFALHSFTPQRV